MIKEIIDFISNNWRDIVSILSLFLAFYGIYVAKRIDNRQLRLQYFPKLSYLGNTIMKNYIQVDFKITENEAKIISVRNHSIYFRYNNTRTFPFTASNNSEFGLVYVCNENAEKHLRGFNVDVIYQDVVGNKYSVNVSGKRGIIEASRPRYKKFIF